MKNHCKKCPIKRRVDGWTMDLQMQYVRVSLSKNRYGKSGPHALEKYSGTKLDFCGVWLKSFLSL